MEASRRSEDGRSGTAEVKKVRREMWSGTLGRGSDGGEAGGDQVGGEDSRMETIKTEPEGSAHTGGTGRNPKDPKLRERGRGHAADAGYNFLSGSRSRRTLSKTCRNLYLSVQWTCSRLNTKEGGGPWVWARKSARKPLPSSTVFRFIVVFRDREQKQEKKSGRSGAPSGNGQL